MVGPSHKPSPATPTRDSSVGRTVINARSACILRPSPPSQRPRTPASSAPLGLQHRPSGQAFPPTKTPTHSIGIRNLETLLHSQQHALHASPLRRDKSENSALTRVGWSWRDGTPLSHNHKLRSAKLKGGFQFAPPPSPPATRKPGPTTAIPRPRVPRRLSHAAEIPMPSGKAPHHAKSWRSVRGKARPPDWGAVATSLSRELLYSLLDRASPPCARPFVTCDLTTLEPHRAHIAKPHLASSLACSLPARPMAARRCPPPAGELPRRVALLRTSYHGHCPLRSCRLLVDRRVLGHDVVAGPPWVGNRNLVTKSLNRDRRLVTGPIGSIAVGSQGWSCKHACGER